MWWREGLGLEEDEEGPSAIEVKVPIFQPIDFR